MKDVRLHIVWNQATRNIILSQSKDAWETARLFALIHTAMADGASAMFKALYTPEFYRWRPITAITITEEHERNPNTIQDRSWKPKFATPRVPEYPSSFGVLSGATGEILKLYFGRDNITIDIKNQPLRRYSSISEAVYAYTNSKI